MNDRLAMPGAMPADLAERLSDVATIEITPALLDQAREEMILLLLEGKQVGRITFADILDCEVDSNVRATVADVAQHLCNIVDFARDAHTHVERRAALLGWMRGMVERWVDSHPDDVRERAEAIAADEGDDQC